MVPPKKVKGKFPLGHQPMDKAVKRHELEVIPKKYKEQLLKLAKDAAAKKVPKEYADKLRKMFKKVAEEERRNKNN